MSALAVVLLLFGSGKISGLMGDFAKGIKSFKKNMAEDDASMEASATDKPAGKITLAVRLGDTGTRILYQSLLGLAAVMTVALMRATPWCALGFLAAPLALKAAGPVRTGKGGRDLIPVLRDTGLTMLVWSVAVATVLALH